MLVQHIYIFHGFLQLKMHVIRQDRGEFMIEITP